MENRHPFPGGGLQYFADYSSLEKYLMVRTIWLV